MKGSRWLLVLAASLFGYGANAQPPAPKPPAEMAHLKALEGSWLRTVKMTGSPEPSTGFMVYRGGLRGMWLTSQFQAVFGGQTFLGQGFDSYNPAKKKYVSVWMDSMETSPMVMEGDFDKDGKTMTMVGEGPG